MVSIAKKIEKNISHLVKENLIIMLENTVIPIIIGIIQEDYSSMLMDIVIDKRSKARPEQYRDEFNYRLDNFEFIEFHDTKVTLITPDIEIFDFSGQLKILRIILEGISGVYIEVNEDEYIEIFGSMPMGDGSMDDLYLIQYSSFIMRREKELNKKFVHYPFSNSPPLDIFVRAEEFITNNLDNWIDEAIDKVKKEI